MFKNSQLEYTHVYRTTPERVMPWRLLSQCEALRGEIIRSLPSLIAMEAEIWTSNPSQSSQASAVQATYQTMIYSLAPCPRFLSVNVSHVKKWIGAQKKQEILLAVYKKYQREFKDDNEADAFVIGVIGDAFLMYEQHGPEALPWTQPQKEVLAKLKEKGLVWETPRPTKKSSKKGIVPV